MSILAADSITPILPGGTINFPTIDVDNGTNPNDAITTAFVDTFVSTTSAVSLYSDSVLYNGTCGVFTCDVYFFFQRIGEHLVTVSLYDMHWTVDGTPLLLAPASGSLDVRWRPTTKVEVPIAGRYQSALWTAVVTINTDGTMSFRTNLQTTSPTTPSTGYQFWVHWCSATYVVT